MPQEPGTIIPAQHKGSQSGAEKKVKSTTRHHAILLFNEAKMRLLNVNKWHTLCGKASAEFQLTDKNGNVLNTIIADKGNLIRISLPAPRNEEGEGYDWVKIEETENTKDLIKDTESCGFRVRPVANPMRKDNKPAHFYTEAATSTFLVIRQANTVRALERGKNEKANVKHLSVINKIRNLIVACSAKLGLSKPQW